MISVKTTFVTGTVLSFITAIPYVTTSPTIATSKFAPFAINNIAVFTVLTTLDRLLFTLVTVVLLGSVTTTSGSPGT